MKDLDSINVAIKSSGYLFRISLIIPIIMGFGALALATGAGINISFLENYLAIFALCMILMAIAAIPVPYLFKWDWKAKFFGACALPFACFAVVGFYPILCILQYSSLPIYARVSIVVLEITLCIGWCRRVIEIYKNIFNDKDLFRKIYTEENDAIYYLQQGDRFVIDKVLKFSFFPPGICYGLFLIFALALIPFATSLSHWSGISFTHFFLAVIFTPVNMAVLALSTKMWLVYYAYPEKLSRSANKVVYVDMVTKPI